MRDPKLLPLPLNEHASEIVDHINDAHVTARQRLQVAAETRKRFYDRDLGADGTSRKVRRFQPGERVLLKISDHHMHMGKLNARFEGPYFVLTVFDNGTVRVKEEGQPLKPPKMVHHDRLRRFEQQGIVNVPQWVHDAIASFEKRKTVGVQTQPQDADIDARGRRRPSSVCVICKKNKQDEHGLNRTINSHGECQLCK